MCKNHNDFSFAFPLNVLKPFFLTNESLNLHPNLTPLHLNKRDKMSLLTWVFTPYKKETQIIQ